MKELLLQFTQGNDMYLHLVFLGVLLTSAALIAASALSLLIQRDGGGVIARGSAWVAALLNAGAMWLAVDCVDLGQEASSYRLLLNLYIGYLALVSLHGATSAPNARTGTLLTASQGMVSIGTLIYLLLLGALPKGLDPSWELRHLTEFMLFGVSGFFMLLTVSFTSAREQRLPSVVLAGLAASLGVVVFLQGFAQHPGAGLSVILPAVVPPLGCVGWLMWLMFGRWRGLNGSAAVRTLRSGAIRVWENPLFVAAVVAAPLLMASAAFLLGGSGSARAVSRVSIGGLSITPGLMTPFLFALALGLLVGRERWRWKGRGGIVLTVLMAGLLFAQKEIGNIAVILLVASMVYLVARGTILHLMAGGALAGAGVIMAYQLAPIFSFIPFTVRERIHLWLGGAEFLRRGGHLVTATHATYKLGGFWGIGVHENPGVNIPRLVIAIHTDFPLVIVGLFGGCILLTVYITFFTAAGLCMLDTIRSLGFEGDTRRARWQAPILAGFFAVPVGSTIINLAGAITQVTPFTGVPVMLISYSSIFLMGTFAILASFVLTGNRAALLKGLHEEGQVFVKSKLEAPKRISISSSRPPVEMPQDPNLLVAQQVHSEYAPQTSKLSGWRRWVSVAGWKLMWDRAGRALRLRDVDGGVLVVCVVIVAIAAIFMQTLYTRYTDTTVYIGHPRLTTEEILIEPTKDPAKTASQWSIVESTDPELIGELVHNTPFQVGSVDMVLRGSSLLVRGGCFAPQKLQQGVTLGFEGILDAPPLPFINQNAMDSTMKRLRVKSEKTNDIVLPFGDIAMRHLRVRMVGEDAFEVRELNEAGADWDAIDQKGRVKPRPLEPTLTLGEGFRLGVRRPRSFFLRKDGDKICISMKRGGIFQYALSKESQTRLGNMSLLRRQFATRTTDFVYAQDVKAAAEAKILYAQESGTKLAVIPHDKAARDSWDERTRRLFYSVFRILKIKNEDGTLREVLAWARPFYSDGGRRFSATRELGAFILQEDRVVGLADSYRFSNVLPVLYKPNDPERNGLIYDRLGRPLVAHDEKGEVLSAAIPGTVPLIGFDFRKRGVRDGLLRVFSRALRGVEPVADLEGELDDRLQGRDRGPWGWDVITTLDADIQREAHAILQSEVRKLYEKEPETIHHASAVILGPRNEVIAAVQSPAVDEVNTLEDAKDYKRRQNESPLDAPALDAFHRRTTMGSTIKLLTMITAFRHKDDSLVKWKDGEWYINAEQDPANASLGRYIETGGALRSWRGNAIAPVHNYGRSTFGRVVPLRTLLIKSLNTASAYMGLNVGKDRYYQYFRDTGMLDVPRVELLPPELGREGSMGHLVDRYPRDPAGALPVSLGAIPAWEKWTLSLTARLPLSGISDYSSMTTALGASVIAREGIYHFPRIVRGMRNRKTGERITFKLDRGVRIIERDDAETMQDYMRDVIRRGTGGGYRLGIPREVWSDAGGKTGTGETVVPVNPNAKYSLKNKPKTRDNKAFVAVWPTSSAQPFVVAVVFEQVSHLDRGIAVRTAQRLMESVRANIVSQEVRDQK